MVLQLVSPPVDSPVSLVTIKLHLRIEHAHEDDYLKELIRSATAYVEGYIRQTLITRTYRQFIDVSSGVRKIKLATWPVQGIKQVKVFDRLGLPKLLTETDFRLDKTGDPATLSLKPGLGLTSYWNGIEVDFYAGYGKKGLDLPSSIVRAIYLIIAHWYEFRGASADHNPSSLPEGIETLLANSKRMIL